MEHLVVSQITRHGYLAVFFLGLSAWMWVIRGIRVGESAAHDGYRAAVRAAAICAHLAGHAKGPSRGGGAEAGHVWPADP